MKNKYFITTIAFVLFVCHLYAQVKDIDGNTYKTVTIGTQIWTAENLNVSHFRNGDAITEAKTLEDWKRFDTIGMPAWCYYNNDKELGNTYGKLYNWFAVNDSRGLAPEGYHIPTNAEWIILTDYLGGEDTAGIKMKSTSGWNDYKGKSGNGNNSSGFNGLPSGHNTTYEVPFNGLGTNALWWSTTENIDKNWEGKTTNFFWVRHLFSVWNKIDAERTITIYRFSVRCIKN